jgi:hypothetical protein
MLAPARTARRLPAHAARLTLGTELARSLVLIAGAVLLVLVAMPWFLQQAAGPVH